MRSELLLQTKSSARSEEVECELPLNL